MRARARYRTGMMSFDGQGSGGNTYGTFWEPPHGWVNSQDGGRGHTFPVHVSVRVCSLPERESLLGTPSMSSVTLRLSLSLSLSLSPSLSLSLSLLVSVAQMTAKSTCERECTRNVY